MHGRQQTHSSQMAAAIGTHGTAAAAATGAAQLLTDSLERLAQLRRAGELSEPEYSAAKAAVLGL
jgi:hypothetical protein